MEMVKVLGSFENDLSDQCYGLVVVDSSGDEISCLDFHCRFEKSKYTGELYYMLMGEFVNSYYSGVSYLCGSYNPEDILNECERLKHQLDVLNKSVVGPQ